MLKLNRLLIVPLHCLISPSMFSCGGDLRFLFSVMFRIRSSLVVYMVTGCCPIRFSNCSIRHHRRDRIFSLSCVGRCFSQIGVHVLCTISVRVGVGFGLLFQFWP